jgi:hypothetical protein
VRTTADGALRVVVVTAGIGIAAVEVIASINGMETI